MKILFASAEAHPIAKTGGLGDVGAGLPAAYRDVGADVRLVIPAYRGSLDKIREPWRIAELQVHGRRFTIWEGKLQGCNVTTWVVGCDELYGRGADPYRDPGGAPWPDLAWRFGCFSEAVARLALGEMVGWRCDALHLNDWHTGLAAWHVRTHARRPRVVFTIHNLAYQGVFGRHDFNALGLPGLLWTSDALEFHGGWSFMKAGILHADAITTVSPTYAEEIQLPESGEGLDGLLRARSAALSGILNGIDVKAWDPETDPHLVRSYSSTSVSEGKQANKAALQRDMGLPIVDVPVLGIVARLVHQKGIDLVLAAASELQRLPIQIAILGSGEPGLQDALRRWASSSAMKVAVRIGHDEPLAHRIEAGADFFLMPSRYEPCGMNQMYSQRYGTIPIVRRVGGLADSVVNATAASLQDGTATGVHFEQADAGGILYGVRRACELRNDHATWRAMQRQGMQRDFSWDRAASSYLTLARPLATGKNCARV